MLVQPPRSLTADIGQLVDVVVHGSCVPVNNQLVLFELLQHVVDHHKRQFDVVGEHSAGGISAGQQQLQEQRFDLAFAETALSQAAGFERHELFGRFPGNGAYRRGPSRLGWHHRILLLQQLRSLLDNLIRSRGRSLSCGGLLVPLSLFHFSRRVARQPVDASQQRGQLVVVRRSPGLGGLDGLPICSVGFLACTGESLQQFVVVEVWHRRFRFSSHRSVRATGPADSSCAENR